MAYQVIDINKSNKFEGLLKHINRTIHSSNVQQGKSKNNIILHTPQYFSEKEFLKAKKEDIQNFNDSKISSTKRRMVREDDNFYMQIVVSHSNSAMTETESIKYLKECETWLKNKFPNNEILYSEIHLDETTPHLHLGLSYFDKVNVKFNQKELSQQGLTDFAILQNEMHREVSKNFNLDRGVANSNAISQKSTHPKSINLNKGLQEAIKANQEKKIITKGFLDQEEYVDKKTYDKILEVAKQANDVFKTPNYNRENQVNKKEIAKIKKTHAILNHYEENLKKLQSLTPFRFLNLKETSSNKVLMNSPLSGGKDNFYLNFKNNRWSYFDFKTNTNGDMIQLYSLLNNKNFNETLLDYTNNLMTITQGNFEQKDRTGQEVDSYENIDFNLDLRDEEIDYEYSDLFRYLSERGIKKEDIDYKNIKVMRNNDWNVCNLYINNDSGGINQFNRGKWTTNGGKSFKGCLGTNDLTTIKNKQNRVTIIVEGVFDYLSFQKTHKETVDYIILNSTINAKNIRLDKDMRYIIALNNDEAGIAASNQIIKELEDMRHKNFINVLPNSNDFNQDLINGNFDIRAITEKARNEFTKSNLQELEIKEKVVYEDKQKELNKSSHRR
ncbi:MAG: plasmid recombination protein [Sulfurimonas sp.]|jgi:hypothetical protein